MLPTLFISHGGGPLPLMGEEPAEFLKSLPTLLTDEERNQIKSILVVSAHWEEPTITISSSSLPKMLFDYYGFPSQCYQYKYEAPGNPELAHKIQSICKKSNIPCNLDDKRGFDHATFVPLMLAFPEAKIPVVQISLQKDLNPEFHISLGKVLSQIRDEVLIIGSGFSFHNLRVFFDGNKNNESNKKSEQFDKWLRNSILNTNTWEECKKLLVEWKSAPEALYAHPREDHLIPLHVVFGASHGCKAFSISDESIMGIKVSSFLFR